VNPNIYNINWRRLAIWFLPIPMRKQITIDWLQSWLQPIKTLWADFLLFRDQAIYKVAHTSQVCYMEAGLNDLFDNTLRRIAIKNGLFIEPLYVYTVDEEKPLWLHPEDDNKPLWLYSEDDLNNNDTDFIVCVPIDLQPANTVALNAYLSRIKALINYYKLASKTYTIEWII
jgi:hypothetical protein